MFTLILQTAFPVSGAGGELESAFFTSDPVFQDIADGDITDHTFSGTSPSNIQYRISSALKMLDFAYQDPFSPSTLKTFRIAFQRIHNIAETDFITSEFILLLDEALLQHEQTMQHDVTDFPIDENFFFGGRYVEYVPHDVNEPTKDHVRYFFASLLAALPEHIAPRTLETVYYFFRCQSHGIIKYVNGNTMLQYIPGGAVFKRTRISPSHALEVATFFHEYAHQIDSFLYHYFYPHSGMVETRAFYEILLDMEDEISGPYGTYAKHNADSRFVTGYSDGWEHPEYPGYFSVVESFAESFALYVVNGKLYRYLAEIDDNYMQQYEWLKTNVFDGIEYDTGSESCITNRSPSWDYTANSPPPSVTDTIRYCYLKDVTSYDNPVFSLKRYVEKVPSEKPGWDRGDDGDVGGLELAAFVHETFDTTMRSAFATDFSNTN